MHREFLLLSAVVFALVYCGVGVKCFAQEGDVSALFEQAERCEKDANYVEAEAIYKDIAKDDAGTEYGLRAQQKLACLYIKIGRMAEAETAYQELLAGYSDHNSVADAVDEVADAYRGVKKFEKALEIYSYLVDTWGESEQAIGSQGCIARINVKLGREEAAQEATDKLIGSFSSNEGTANAVDEVADAYRNVKKYEKALELYKYILDSWPESEQAMGTQTAVAKLNIECGDDPNAEAAVDKLIVEFAERNDIADFVDDVADKYWEVKRYEKALELYKYIVDSWPESEQAIGSHGCIARVNIECGDDPNAEAAVDKLIADFSANSGFPTVLCEIAGGYEKVNKYQDAKGVYQQIIEHEPNSPEAGKAQLDIAKVDVLSLIESGDDTVVPDALDYMIADFYEHSYLGEAIFRVGEKYYNEAFSCENRGLESESKDYFSKTVAVWEVIITKVPESGITAYTYHLTADCYRRLGQYEKAIDYYREIVANWPAYKNAGYAQFLIGYSYKKMRRDGAVSASIAHAEIRAAYELVIEKYPNCPAAKAAHDWLNYHNKSDEGEEK